MTTIPQIARSLRRVLTDFADAAARRTGFVKRTSKITGSRFAQALVFGWLGHPDASLSQLTQAASAVGADVSNQALDQRFTPEAAAFLQEVLEAAVGEVITADPVAIPILQRFSSVVLQDSSTIVLPNCLSKVWRGNGSRTGDGESALKLEVRLDLSRGTLSGPLLENGRSQDRNCPIQNLPLPPGALRIADLGFFSLNVLRDLAARGDFYLTRLQVGTAVFDESGNRLDLLRVLRRAGPASLDLAIQLGSVHRLRARLLAAPVPEAVANERRRRMRRAAKERGQTPSKEALALASWTILVTNAPHDKLSVAEALVLARARWQIELLFKLWKQHGKVDESRSSNPWRILCETYAKLTAVVIQHWLALVSIWAYPDRSLVKAFQTIQQFAMTLLLALHRALPLITALTEIVRCLASGCRMNRRRTKPNTYQLLLELDDAA